MWLRFLSYAWDFFNLFVFIKVNPTLAYFLKLSWKSAHVFCRRRCICWFYKTRLILIIFILIFLRLYLYFNLWICYRCLIFSFLKIIFTNNCRYCKAIPLTLIKNTLILNNANIKFSTFSLTKEQILNSIKITFLSIFIFPFHFSIYTKFPFSNFDTCQQIIFFCYIEYFLCIFFWYFAYDVIVYVRIIVPYSFCIASVYLQGCFWSIPTVFA